MLCSNNFVVRCICHECAPQFQKVKIDCCPSVSEIESNFENLTHARPLYYWYYSNIKVYFRICHPRGWTKWNFPESDLNCCCALTWLRTKLRYTVVALPITDMRGRLMPPGSSIQDIQHSKSIQYFQWWLGLALRRFCWISSQQASWFAKRFFDVSNTPRQLLTSRNNMPTTSRAVSPAPSIGHRSTLFLFFVFAQPVNVLTIWLDTWCFCGCF